MLEFTEDQYRDVCRSGRVQIEINSVEEKRAAALRQFWLFLVCGLAAAALAAWGLIAADLAAVGAVAAAALATGAIVLATRPLGKVGRDLKLPFLTVLAEKGGLSYSAGGFDPPVYRDAQAMLFGKWLSGEAFTDLFFGADEDGRRFAVYEATLTRSSGKSTHIVFTGQIYAFQRRRHSGGRIAIVPDRGIFNFFKPQRGMERVKFEADPDFEKKFEVYADEPHEALMLLGADVRRRFLEWRLGGRVLAYVGPEDVFVAIPGKNRFEAGSMFRARSGEARARLMFEDVRASLALLASLRASLD
jgi:hypothetical protein